MKRYLSVFSALGGAIAASSCCLGPIALASLGVGSGGALFAFERYRPYLLGATAVSLGVAFWVTYRRTRDAKPECGCETQPGSRAAGRGGRTLLWIVAALSVLFAMIPYLRVGASVQAMPGASAAVPATLRLQIGGMSCSVCARGIQGTLAEMKGVVSAQVDFDSASATVRYDSTATTSRAVFDKIGAAGYSASPTPFQPKTR
jgi:copper chaperone CopZ